MSLDGMEQYFSRYTDVSDVRIFWSGLLGMIGITLETMSFFGVYRIIASKSESYAHAYRAGLIGMLAFGAFCHVMCCVTIYHHNVLYRIDPSRAIEGTIIISTGNKKKGWREKCLTSEITNLNT